MNRPLHIVCLDAPAPPDYGGAIDMFYKIKALAAVGWRIHLHYFNYHGGRGTAELENDCEAIYKYPRNSAINSLPFNTPYIIRSRTNTKLIERLNEDEHPILLEGLHCAGLIPQIKKQSRIILRMHNEEAAYYRHLAHTEASLLKRLYFDWESRLLKQYQLAMNKQIQLACLSQTDETFFKETYGFRDTRFVPCFIPWQSLTIKTSKGAYCLYHGNLSVAENEEAALWLMTNVFSSLSYPLIIAGKGVSSRLMKEAAKHKNVSLVNNPSIAVIDGLVREAHINVLPSLNRTGVKLKLLNALFNGRHCITNDQGAAGSGIVQGVTRANEPEAWQEAISKAMQVVFGVDEIAERKTLFNLYNNRKNALILSEGW